jgi:hypothetical protein
MRSIHGSRASSRTYGNAPPRELLDSACTAVSCSDARLTPPPRPTTDDLVRIMAADTYVRTSWGGRWVRGRRRRRRRRLHSSRQSAACICNCFAIIMRAMHGTKRNASLAVSVKLVRATAAPTYIRGLGFHRRTSQVKACMPYIGVRTFICLSDPCIGVCPPVRV